MSRREICLFRGKSITDSHGSAVRRRLVARRAASALEPCRCSLCVQSVELACPDAPFRYWPLPRSSQSDFAIAHDATRGSQRRRSPFAMGYPGIRRATLRVVRARLLAFTSKKKRTKAKPKVRATRDRERERAGLQREREREQALREKEKPRGSTPCYSSGSAWVRSA